MDKNSGSSHGNVNSLFGSIGFFKCGAMPVATAQRVISHWFLYCCCCASRIPSNFKRQKRGEHFQNSRSVRFNSP